MCSLSLAVDSPESRHRSICRSMARHDGREPEHRNRRRQAAGGPTTRCSSYLQAWPPQGKSAERRLRRPSPEVLLREYLLATVSRSPPLGPLTYPSGPDLGSTSGSSSPRSLRRTPRAPSGDVDHLEGSEPKHGSDRGEGETRPAGRCGTAGYGPCGGDVKSHLPDFRSLKG